MSIKFYNDPKKDTIIDSATLTQNDVAKYVVNNGMVNDTLNEHFICQMDWINFLEMLRENMTTMQQWLNPNYMKIINDDIYDVIVSFQIRSKIITITEKDGLVNLVPIMISARKEVDLVLFDFIKKPQKEIFTINVLIIIIIIIGIILLPILFYVYVQF